VIHWLFLVPALLLGGWLGMAVMGVCSAAGRGETWRDGYEHGYMTCLADQGREVGEMKEAA
jgi:hypothetical protein